MPDEDRGAARRFASDWSAPPRRIGPIEEDPFWIELLTDIAPYGCAIVAAVTCLIAAYAWGVDLLTGHL